ncbi:MAG: SO_0444 family Cu/Zn efflux transporter [Phycisphaerales bacterium JB043]
MLLESGSWLIVGFGLAGVVHTLMPMDWIRRQLGRDGFGSVFKAALLGIPLPLCSCSVIPMAASIRREGASKGATASFTVSTPETGAETIALTWGILGPVIAIARPISALATAIAAGVGINALDRDVRVAQSEPVESCCSSEKTASCCVETEPTTCCGSEKDESCCHTSSEASEGVVAKLMEAFRWGYVRMPADIGVLFVVGLAISALVAASVPSGWIESHVGTGIVPKLAMLVVGLPIYVCAAASTPVAASLIVAGLTPGAAMVFLLAGPATNTATMSWLLKDLGVRSLAIYLIVIAVVSVLVGVAIDVIWSDMVIPFTQSASHGAHEHDASVWDTTAAGLLCLVLIVGVGNWVRGKILR